MANPSYLTIEGERQGNITADCLGMASLGNKCQLDQKDSILVLNYEHSLYLQGGQRTHAPLVITKPVDKSSPLLFNALTQGEKLTCQLLLTRTSTRGDTEVFYTIRLMGAVVNSLQHAGAHAISQSDEIPTEVVTFSYQSIAVEHKTANTSGSDYWVVG